MRVHGVSKTNLAAMRSRPIYLDYQASTPVAPEVAEAMAPWWGSAFGNPHSVTHSFGWDARDAVAAATAQAAVALNADDEEIIFVSGATESCNLALAWLPEPERPGPGEAGFRCDRTRCRVGHRPCP